MEQHIYEQRRQALKDFTYLPLFYFIPDEIAVKRNLDNFPRDPFLLAASEKWREVYFSKWFQVTLLDTWGWMMWQCLGIRGGVDNYSKNDPFVIMAFSLPMRPIEPDGSWGAKSKKEYIFDENGEKIRLKSGEYKSKKVCATDWNEQTKAEEWRQGWADICNRYLEQNNHTERIDHRSYERQGIEKIPTIHLDVAASAMEKRGIKTERGNINREIEVTNKDISQLRARIRKSKEWLYSQPIENAPTFVSIMGHVAGSKNLDNRWQKIVDLKTRAKVFAFLQSNNITDMAHLVEKITQMSNEHYEVSEKIKKVDRRLGILAQHLTQYEIYKQHQDLYKKYKSLDPKKRDDFYDKHSERIQDYENAKEYLKAVMNGKTDIPIKAWKAEQEKLTAERFSLCKDYYRLKDEVHSVEILRRGAESLMLESKETIEKDKNIKVDFNDSL